MVSFRYPVSVVWEITDVCNMMCGHCRASAIKAKVKPNLMDDIILRNILESKVFAINLSGGEPLLHPDVLRFVKALHEAQIDVCISTNGWFFLDLAEQLIEAGLNMLQVSIDGPEKLHDSFRGRRSAYQHAVRALKKAVELGIRTQLNTTITSINIDYIEHSVEVARNLGVDRVFYRRIIPYGRSRVNNSLLPNREKYLRCITDLSMLDVDGPKISIDDPVLNVLRLPKESNVIGCGAGIKSLGISCHGEVFPCIFFREKIGTLKEKSLIEIWQHSDVLRRLRNREIKVCGMCQHKERCGGCRAYSGMFNRDSLCPLDCMADGHLTNFSTGNGLQCSIQRERMQSV